MATFTTTQETVRFTDTDDAVSFTATPGRVTFTAAYQSVTGGGGGGGLTEEQTRDLVAGFITAGDNVTVTHDDPGNTLTIAATGGTTLDFLYDASATQAGNVYTSWSDLMTAVEAAKAFGTPLVRFRSSTADGALQNRVKINVPSGAWDLGGVILESGMPYEAVTLVCGTGVTITDMHGLQLRRGIVIRSESSAALHTPPPGSTLIECHNASGLCSDVVPMIDASNNGVQLLFVIDDEAGIWNGYNISGEDEGNVAVANSSGSNNVFFITVGQKGSVSNNVFSGHVLYYAYRCGSSSAVNATITNTGFTFDFNGSLNLNKATNIRVDATGFNGNLSSSDDDVQKVAQKVDDLVVSGGSGDVVGPASSVDGRAVLFDGTTGKLIKQASAAPVLEGDSRLTDSRTPTAHKTSHATGGSDALAPSDIGAAPTSRTITAGTGLTGGGDLSADRTLAVSYGTTAGTAAQGNDSRLSDSRTPTGSAGGDLTGTYPNPTIGSGAVTNAKIASNAAIAGSKLAPSGGPSTYSSTQGYMLPGVFYTALANAVALTANRIWYVPFRILAGTLTVDRMHCEVTTGVAASNLRMGVYAADTSWQPTGAALIDVTATSAVSGQSRNVTVSSVQLPAGRYLACIVSDAAISVRAGAAINNWGSDHGGSQITSPSSAQVITGRAANLTYPASLPNTGPAWTIVTATATPATAANDPVLLLRGTSS